MTCFMHYFGYGCGIREDYVSVLTYLSFSLLQRERKRTRRAEYSRQNPPAKNAKQDPSWALGRKCASLIHSMQVLRSSWTVKCETYFNCGRPLENVWPRGRYQKNFRARQNEMKKNHALQITLKTFTQRLQRLNKFIQGQCFGKKNHMRPENSPSSR